MTDREFVEAVAALTTDDEMAGDMPGDDAVTELSGLIETARAILRDAHKKEAA